MSSYEIRQVAQGYFLEHRIWEWIPHGNAFAGDSVIQVVVSEKYH